MRTVLIAGATFLALSRGLPAQSPTVNTSASESFVGVHGPSNLSSRIVGLQVYNRDNRAVGQIVDIAMTKDGQTRAYILSVGSFLGLEVHYVAVEPSAVTLGYSNADQAWRARMNATPDQLKAAPTYQYPGRIAEKACINILR